MPEPAYIAPVHTRAPFQLVTEMPAQVSKYPRFRYMGSKNNLLPWIHDVLTGLDFDSACDPFSGGCSVAYLMKAMGKQVAASDFLNFPSVIGKALIENPGKHLDKKNLAQLLKSPSRANHFIEDTYSGIYFTIDDLKFLDRVSSNISDVADQHLQAVAMTALLRSCLKKQPRGVFTITGDLSNYDDGRRDLKLSMEQHFTEQITAINSACFDNGRNNNAMREDVFSIKPNAIDLVYLDPPYVPRSDDNCYIKRYHFLEGLSCYWKDVEIDYSTKTKKIVKRQTPFSYRSEALDAFDRMFRLFRNQKIVLSYSSNGFPDLKELEQIMGKYKSSISTFSKPHRYHFGNHASVERSKTIEYLLVGE